MVYIIQNLVVHGLYHTEPGVWFILYRYRYIIGCDRMLMEPMISQWLVYLQCGRVMDSLAGLGGRVAPARGEAAQTVGYEGRGQTSTVVIGSRKRPGVWKFALLFLTFSIKRRVSH